MEVGVPVYKAVDNWLLALRPMTLMTNRRQGFDIKVSFESRTKKRIGPNKALHVCESLR